ncbi:hypothetical protein [Arthronema virus TR020]|uniref:Uncharacterized protein n=1 Tax=Arthronema virus TR020 TaxID=2736280 RepID=A0A7G3WH10_9CAUD|nr:hypothetical protein [Arthronema virus TR020]
MDLFVIQFKDGSYLLCKRYVLEDSGSYYFDGAIYGFPMDDVIDITPVYVAVESSRVGNLRVLNSVSTDYKGVRYLVTSLGVYSLVGSVFVKLPVSLNYQLRTMLTGMYHIAAKDYN